MKRTFALLAALAAALAVAMPPRRRKARSRRSRIPAHHHRPPRRLAALLLLRRQAAAHRLRHGPVREDRRRGEGRAEDAQPQDQLPAGHLRQPHPADGERHHRPRVRLDHQQPRAPGAGVVHQHPLRHRQPLGGEEVRQAEDAAGPEGQDHRLDRGHHQHQADHRDQRGAEPRHEHHLGQRPSRGVPDGRDRPRGGVRDGRHPARRPGRAVAHARTTTRSRAWRSRSSPTASWCARTTRRSRTSSTGR